MNYYSVRTTSDAFVPPKATTLVTHKPAERNKRMFAQPLLWPLEPVTSEPFELVWEVFELSPFEPLPLKPYPLEP